ncbi:MAG TPA: KH domain-containing protein [Vitreimonas sp.]|nr:KH domain-containing protein [Vitreimonas sp.]
MKNLLEFLLIHLVDHPEDVVVEEHEDDRGVVFTLHVHPDDMGRVIGKGGAVIQSIRNIAKIRAVKEGIRAHIVLAEAEEGSEAAPEAVAA